MRSSISFHLIRLLLRECQYVVAVEQCTAWHVELAHYMLLVFSTSNVSQKQSLVLFLRTFQLDSASKCNIDLIDCYNAMHAIDLCTYLFYPIRYRDTSSGTSNTPCRCPSPITRFIFILLDALIFLPIILSQKNIVASSMHSVLVSEL